MYYYVGGLIAPHERRPQNEIIVSYMQCEPRGMSFKYFPTSSEWGESISKGLFLHLSPAVVFAMREVLVLLGEGGINICENGKYETDEYIRKKEVETIL